MGPGTCKNDRFNLGSWSSQSLAEEMKDLKKSSCPWAVGRIKIVNPLFAYSSYSYCKWKFPVAKWMTRALGEFFVGESEKSDLSCRSCPVPRPPPGSLLADKPTTCSLQLTTHHTTSPRNSSRFALAQDSRPIASRFSRIAASTFRCRAAWERRRRPDINWESWLRSHCRRERRDAPYYALVRNSYYDLLAIS